MEIKAHSKVVQEAIISSVAIMKLTGKPVTVPVKDHIINSVHVQLGWSGSIWVDLEYHYGVTGVFQLKDGGLY